MVNIKRFVYNIKHQTPIDDFLLTTLQETPEIGSEVKTTCFKPDEEHNLKKFTALGKVHKISHDSKDVSHRIWIGLDGFNLKQEMRDE